MTSTFQVLVITAYILLRIIPTTLVPIQVVPTLLAITEALIGDNGVPAKVDPWYIRA